MLSTIADREPMVSVVFLTYNRRSECEATLKHLHERVGEGEVFETIIIDNGSTDGTAEFLESLDTANLRVCRLDVNEGIAGYHRAFEMARCPYVLVLDDDSHPERGCITELVEVFNNSPDVALVACRISCADGSRFDSWHIPDTDERQESFSFVGCGFGVRRQQYLSLGGYPSEFFLYQNEVDLSLRIRASGMSQVFVPEARVCHRVQPGLGSAAERRVFYPTRNSLWVIRKYFSGWAKYYMLLSRVLIGFLACVYHRSLWAYLRAVVSGVFYPVARSDFPVPVATAMPFFSENSLLHLWRHFKKVGA